MESKKIYDENDPVKTDEGKNIYGSSEGAKNAGGAGLGGETLFCCAGSCLCANECFFWCSNLEKAREANKLVKDHCNNQCWPCFSCCVIVLMGFFALAKIALSLICDAIGFVWFFFSFLCTCGRNTRCGIWWVSGEDYYVKEDETYPNFPKRTLNTCEWLFMQCQECDCTPLAESCTNFCNSLVSGDAFSIEDPET